MQFADLRKRQLRFHWQHSKQQVLDKCTHQTADSLNVVINADRQARETARSLC